MKHFFKGLCNLVRKGYRPPIAALNVLIEACVKTNSPRAAFGMYDHVRNAVPDGPNNETFHLMFEAARLAKSVDGAFKLAHEHHMMRLKPDALIYDGVIQTCLESGHDIYTVVRFYHDMHSLGITPLPQTLRALYCACRLANHPDSKHILDRLVEISEDEEPIAQLVIQTNELYKGGIKYGQGDRAVNQHVQMSPDMEPGEMLRRAKEIMASLKHDTEDEKKAE
jgi:hypothetical protein